MIATGGKSRLDLAFHLFDLHGNGVISEVELRHFLGKFFAGLFVDVPTTLRSIVAAPVCACSASATTGIHTTYAYSRLQVSALELE